MLKASGWILTAGLILSGGIPAHGQTGFPSGQGLPTGEMSPEMAQMHKARMQLIKEASPELYAYQERLRKIEEKISTIKAGFAKKEIGREAAKAEILPLVKEAREIRDDPEFQVEQNLAQAYFSSPEFRRKIMSSLAKKRKAKR